MHFAGGTLFFSLAALHFSVIVMPSNSCQDKCDDVVDHLVPIWLIEQLMVGTIIDFQHWKSRLGFVSAVRRTPGRKPNRFRKQKTMTSEKSKPTGKNKHILGTRATPPQSVSMSQESQKQPIPAPWLLENYRWQVMSCRGCW